LFSYEENTQTGPDKWAGLNKDWAICSDGKEQSPIDISKVEAEKDMEPLEHTYNAGACTMQNRGHDFIVILFLRTRDFSPG
jgi:carbonic anhydrase